MATAYDWDSRAHDGPQQFSDTPPETKGCKRSRQTYSKYQTAVLETVFQTSKYIVRSKRQQMSAELSLTERQIKIWFQNRRMKEKKCGGGIGGLVGHCKESPPNDERVTLATAVGYADDYTIPELGAVGYHATTPGDLHVRGEDAFADFCHRPVAVAAAKVRSSHLHRDPVGEYTGYGSSGGYDLLTHHEADQYVGAAATKQHHWDAPVTVDYDQDFFGDHDLDHFQRLPTAHHHHRHHHHHPSMNSQALDYCPPQLQVTHGY